EKIRLASPFVLRTVEPRPKELEGRVVLGIRRIGKRLVIGLQGDGEGDLFAVVHLMIAGRFHWKDDVAAKIPGKVGLAAFDVPNGTLLLTEASTKKRAALHIVKGEAALEEFRRGGI